METDLKAFGASAAVIARYRAARGIEADKALAIPPENHAAVRLFEAALTQRRYAGMAGVCVGLDYGAVRLVAAAQRARWDAGLLDDIRLMEAVMLKCLSIR